jgi:hypothetical protein
VQQTAALRITLALSSSGSKDTPSTPTAESHASSGAAPTQHAKALSKARNTSLPIECARDASQCNQRNNTGIPLQKYHNQHVAANHIL